MDWTKERAGTRASASLWDAKRETDTRLITAGRVDTTSFAGGVAAAIGFFVLASLSLSVSRFDSTLASVWLPNAFAVAALLRANLKNEIPFYLGVVFASVPANLIAGTPWAMSAVFSLANVADIVLVVWLTRRMCGIRPDMTALPDLARFVFAGGLVGPIVSASIAASAMLPNSEGVWLNATGWFLTDSMGMVLIVPTILLALDAIERRPLTSGKEAFERGVVMLGGMACVYLVFQQSMYPLLFLVPPITLLHAFRLGSLGTATYVAAVAVVATTMTWIDYGPIAQVTDSQSIRLHLIQAFVAANFLTGLPISAILAGRERMIEELERGKQQIALLADNITDAILRFDRTGKCLYVSPSAVSVLGRRPSDFLGKRPTNQMHDDASERILLAERRLLNGESDNERFTYRRLLDSEDGTPVFIEADCATIYDRESGERDGYVVSARDVTERVELELLLTRARRHAENAARAKSEFLANMSHEIRTPMNGVLGFAELMLEGELEPDQRRHTEMIVQSGRSMMLLLNDILDLSKIEAGQISIDPAPVDLHAMLSDCAALHRPAAEKKGLQLRFTREGDDRFGRRPGEAPEPLFVLTDGLRLRQIVLNLIGNAVKFTQAGTIHVAYQWERDQLSVRVVDSGIGIPASRLKTIFTPFTQGESDTSRRFGGTGLGLSISRQLAQLLGGRLEVESEPGVGSCFTLTLPARRSAPERSPPEDQPDPPALEDLPHDARILLAEDHDVNRILASEMLERCGQSVAIAHDGNEAISMVIDSMVRGRPYDLVLMDVQMPGCDGYTATRAIRAEGIGPETLPIIALTANAFPEDIAAAHDAGMQGHLAKPLVFGELARALQRWLPTRIIEQDDGQEEIDTGTKAGARVVDLKSAQRHQHQHSPELLARWFGRRAEALEAVRNALDSGLLSEGERGAGKRAELSQVVHKLAGTAAMFGEPELGDQAAAFERALRLDLDPEVQDALALELLAIAEESEAQEGVVGEARR